MSPPRVIWLQRPGRARRDHEAGGAGVQAFLSAWKDERKQGLDVAVMRSLDGSHILAVVDGEWPLLELIPRDVIT